MSSRQQLAPFPVITAGDMTGDVTSLVTICLKMSVIQYEVSWTGTPNGTFQAETSESYAINPDGSVKNAGTWTTIPLDSVPAALGAAGNGIIALNKVPGYAVRLRYLHSSSSGTLSALVSGKLD